MTRSLTLPTAWSFHASEIPPERDDHSPGDSPDRARWVLALGIVALVFGPLGLIAWLAGNAVLAAIAEGRMDPTCESNARAGRLLGIVAMCMFAFKVTVLLPLALLFWQQL